jgi:hypothetical protein
VHARQPTLTSFVPLQRMQNSGFGQRGLAEPATFRPQRFTRSRRFTPRDSFRVYFAPVTLLGFHLQGIAPAGKPAPLTRPAALLSFASLRQERPGRETFDFRALLLPESSSCHGPKTPDRRCPPGVLPSKALPASRGGCGFPPPPPLHFTLAGGRFGVFPLRRHWHFLLAEAPTFLGFFAFSNNR